VADAGAVHPFDAEPNPFASATQQITDELPVDVALGKLDYLEIVGFSDHKSTAATGTSPAQRSETDLRKDGMSGLRDFVNRFWWTFLK